MKIKILLLFVLTSMSFSVSARKPAVEDFVGVVPESYKETPKGTEVLFDFGNKIEKVQKVNKLDLKKTNSVNNWSGIVGLGFFLALPFIMWTFITRFKSQDIQTSQYSPSQEPKSTSDETTVSATQTPEGVTNLDDYRKEDSSNTGKKAS